MTAVPDTAGAGVDPAQPEDQAAAPAAVSVPMEPQAAVQGEHAGQEGQEGQQEQRVQPRRAAPTEPHKRQAVVVTTAAAGDHVGTIVDISGPEEAAPAAAPTGGWQMVVRGRGRAARQQAMATVKGGRKPRAAKPAAGMPPGLSGPMAFILDAIRCGRAFDCAQCGELGLWQGPFCESCEGMVTG
mmetsp:Transcript_69719/g.209323  ORF Transcript_69719/g.209323 Transcript_69719/m.209323 type:complete len:185 (+) Transcript_69719:98-652(+)